MFEDLRKARSCSFRDIKTGFDTQVSDAEGVEEKAPLPLSELELSLTEWHIGCADPSDKKSLENIALAVASISRHISGERLLKIEATESAGVSMSFDFMRAGSLKEFSIEIDWNEALAILQADHPIATAVKITDTKIQTALCL